MASLFVIRGRDQGKHYPITGPVVRIGRDSSNQIQLLDSEASRCHAEIRCDWQRRLFELIDLASSNGTAVNSKRIERQRLASGDRIEIGSTLLIFTGGAGAVSHQDAAHGVDIVRQTAGDASQIVSSMSRDLQPRSLTNGGGVANELADGETAFDPVTTMDLHDSKVSAIPVSPPRAIDADRSLEVIYLTALAVGRTDDLNEVLNRVLQLVFDWVEADRGCIMLRDPETKRLFPAARCDRETSRDGSTLSKSAASGSPATRGRISISQTILEYVIRQKEGVRTSDAIDDKRFDAAASIVQGGVREALCVPLTGRYDIVGALYVDTFTPPGELMDTGGANRFHDEHLRLMTAIGHQAALAIEDTFYYSALLQGERLAAMGQTIATLSHHIKNILQGVRGGSYLIETGLQREDTDAIRRGWAIVDRNQERISNLVLDMLTFSKEREPQCVSADLNVTLADVLDLMRVRATEANVELRQEFDVNLPHAHFDPEAMHRAILNLITNAIDAATTTVVVRSIFDSKLGWHIEVEDDGEGIPEEEREQVFSLFESKKGARGTGLGLPVTAKIVREHGGQVTITSGGLGGALFRIALPINPEATAS